MPDRPAGVDLAVLRLVALVDGTRLPDPVVSLRTGYQIFALPLAPPPPSGRPLVVMGYGCGPSMESQQYGLDLLWGNEEVSLGIATTLVKTEGVFKATFSDMHGDWLKTDAPILPGYSGGPAISELGGVIGWNVRSGIDGVPEADPSHEHDGFFPSAPDMIRPLTASLIDVGDALRPSYMLGERGMLFHDINRILRASAPRCPNLEPGKWQLAPPPEASAWQEPAVGQSSFRVPVDGMITLSYGLDVSASDALGIEMYHNDASLDTSTQATLNQSYLTDMVDPTAIASSSSDFSAVQQVEVPTPMRPPAFGEAPIGTPAERFHQSLIANLSRAASAQRGSISPLPTGQRPPYMPPAAQPGAAPAAKDAEKKPAPTSIKRPTATLRDALKVHVEEFLACHHTPKCGLMSHCSTPQCPKKLFDPRQWRLAIADGESLACERNHGGHFRFVLRKVREWAAVTDHPRVRELLEQIPSYDPEDYTYQQFERRMSERRRAIEASFRARPPDMVSSRRVHKAVSRVGEPLGSPLVRRGHSSAGGTPSSSDMSGPLSGAKRQRAVPHFGVTHDGLLDASDAEAADAWAQLINAAAAADGQPERTA